MQLSPVIRDDYSAPFFDAAAQGTLLVRRCANGHYLPPSLGSSNGGSLRCHECFIDDIQWCPASGAGSLVSWVVVHPNRGKDKTFVSGLVELEEGPWMYALLSVATDDDLVVGQPLAVDFVATDGGETIPVFHPV